MRTDIISVDSAPGDWWTTARPALTSVCCCHRDGGPRQAQASTIHTRGPTLLSCFLEEAGCLMVYGPRHREQSWEDSARARLRLVFPIFQVQVEFLSCSSGLFFSLFPGSFLMYFKGRLCTFHFLGDWWRGPVGSHPRGGVCECPGTAVTLITHGKGC